MRLRNGSEGSCLWVMRQRELYDFSPMVDLTINHCHRQDAVVMLCFYSIVYSLLFSVCLFVCLLFFFFFFFAFFSFSFFLCFSFFGMEGCWLLLFCCCYYCCLGPPPPPPLGWGDGGGYIGYIIKTWLEHTFAALLTDGMIRVLCTPPPPPPPPLFGKSASCTLLE